MPVDISSEEKQASPGAARALPPEVEAELRLRLETQQGQGSATGVQAPPAVDAPPAPSAPSIPERKGWEEWLKKFGPAGIALGFLAGKLKILAPVAKFGLPVLQTGGTMLLSILVYAQRDGLPFAAGFVLGILVHELGHVFVAWRMKVPVSAPFFIPGLGALIIQKRAARSTWDEALIGIGGPVAGTLAGLAFLAAHRVTGSSLMLNLAYTSFILNLFNMAPIFPLDGGWITAAISPRIWLLGIIGMAFLFLTGVVRNPLILILVLLSLPRLWKGLRTGDATEEGSEPATPRQRVLMTVYYVGLCVLLAWLAARTYVPF